MATTKRKRRGPRYSAKTADKYELYQLSVQSAYWDLRFLARQFKALRGREPKHLREDFCGTALLCASWVERGKDLTAEGYDLDPEPLAWGRAHNIAPLGKSAARIELFRADVRTPGTKRADVRLAQNFSYCIFKERATLLAYFRQVQRELAPRGLFAIDMYGGFEATEEMEEERKIEGGFTYVWDQHRFLPGTSDYTCHIHFRFRDGTALERAFTYNWRYWGMAELKDLLREAGFRDVRSYFEQTDGPDGTGNGVYRLDETGVTCRNCAGWIAYILALN